MKSLSRIACVPLVLLAASCASGETVSAAAGEVVTFHRLFDDTQFERIYYATSQKLRAPGENGRFLKFLQVARVRLGEVVMSSQIGWNTHHGIDGSTTTTLTYQTQFERGSGKEVFVYALEDGEQRLLDYALNSNELTDAMIDATAARQLDEELAAGEAQNEEPAAGPAAPAR